MPQLGLAIMFILLAEGLVVVGAGWLVALAAVPLVAAALPGSVRIPERLLGAVVILFALDTVLGALTMSAYATCAIWTLPPTMVLLRRRRRERWRRPVWQEWSTLLLFAGAAAVVLIPWQQRSTAAQLAFLQKGSDNAGHLSLVGTIRHHGHYLYGSATSGVRGLVPGLTNYPQGGHMNVAIISNLVSAGDRAPGTADTVAAYSFALCFALLMLIVAMSALAQSLARRAGAAGPGPWMAGLVPVGAVLFGLGVPLLALGFFTQLVGTTGLVLFALFSADAELQARPRVRLFLLACCCVVIASSFYFLAPVLGVSVLALLWQERASGNQASWKALTVFGALTACCALPHMAFSLGSGAAASTNDPGGVTHLLLTPVALLGLSGLLVGLRLRSSAEPHAASVWWATLAGAVLFSIVFGVYQVAALGATSYYYYKSLFTITLLGVVGVGVGVGLAFAVPHARRRGTLAWQASGLLVLIAILAPQLSLKSSSLHKLTQSPVTDRGYSAALRAARTSPGRQVWFWDYGSYLSDYFRNRQIGAALRQDSDFRFTRVHEAANFFEQPETLRDVLDHYGSVIVVTRSKSVRQELRYAGLPAARQSGLTLIVLR